MAKKPIIHLVVTTQCRFDLLEKCLDSIYANATMPVLVTVVDDSGDKLEKAHYPHLFKYDPSKDVHNNVVSFTTKRHEKQEGFPRSANDGAKGTSAKYITF